MTTTLRPSGPEENGPGDVCSRRFDVLVNSRPVGGITVVTGARSGGPAGRLSDLRIDAPDRRRGRGTVAVLAAEEILRGRGLARVEASVPADASVALHMADALGYTETGRHMVKALPASPPDLPAGSKVRPMGPAEYPTWSERARAGYADKLAATGLTPEEARARAEHSHHILLPDGPTTAGTALFVLAHEGTDVGTLWLRLRDAEDTDGPAWVFSVEVDERHRGRGHGRTLMLLAERRCVETGVRALKLNVHRANTPALRLYESLGYVVTTRHFAKRLL